MIDISVILIDVTVRVLTLLIIAHALLSFFMSPFHPIRETLDRIVAPLLNPIRNIMPATGMIDFSPLVLLIVIQLVGSILRTLLLSI